MSKREDIIRMVMEAPDHKIEQLFRDMGIELDLSGQHPVVDIETQTSEDMMFTHLYGDTR